MAEPEARSHLICGADVLTPSGWQEFDLSVMEGVISDRTDQAGRVIDASGLKIVPGYIDLQINGGWGHDLQREPAALWALARRLVEAGVTSFLPTLTTNGYSRRREALTVWRQGPPQRAGYGGAEPVGWHIEGPWLAPSRHGAHSRELLQPVPSEPPNGFTIEDGVRMVTLAPELRGATEMVRALTDRGILVSCGHSEANPLQARAALEAGATMATHLFNAMSGLHHRNVGLAATVLLESCYLGLIVDGVHVDPEMVRLAWRLAEGRIIPVSDAVSVMGTPTAGLPGDNDGVATGDAVRLLDGTLAGSSSALDAGVRNLVAYTGCDLASAVRAVTDVPARALGLHDRGRIEAGRRADLVGLEPDGRVVMTFVGGRLRWDRRSRR